MAPRADKIEIADSVSLLASALNNLADAIKLHAQAMQLPTTFEPQKRGALTAFTTEAALNLLSSLSDSDILIEIKKWSHQRYPDFKSGIDNDTAVDDLVGGDAGAFVSSYQSLDNWPPFHSRGLNLGPNELRHLKTVRDLVVMIRWGLSHHA